MITFIVDSRWGESSLPSLARVLLCLVRVGLKATVENPRCSVDKLSPKESVEGGNTALRGSARAPKEFLGRQTRGFKAEGAQLLRFCSQGFAKENPKGALTLPSSAVSPPEAHF